LKRLFLPLLLVAAIGGAAYAIYKAGQASCAADIAVKQLEKEQTIRRQYDKIDRSLPSDADTPGIADFLLRRTTN